MSKHRIAILISLMLAMPAAVVAVEQAIPSFPPAASEAQPVVAEPAAQPVAESGEQVIGTAPDGGLVRVQPSDTFPKGSDVEWEIMPALAWYLEEMERKRGPLVASGDVYPKGSDVEWELLPAQVAYFDRLKRERMASAQPATQAAAPVSSAASAGESRNPLQKATDYISGLFKPDNATAPAGNTAATQ